MREIHDPFTLLARAKSVARQGTRRLKGVVCGERQHSASISPPVPQPVLGVTKWCKAKPVRRALVVYTPEALRHTLETPYRSNLSQCVQMVSSLNGLGFEVDVIDVHDDRFEPTRDYDLLFGEHANYGRLLDRVSVGAVRVFYGTRDYWRFEQDSVASRLRDLRTRRGLPSDWGYEPGGYSIFENRWVERSDAVVVVGNQFTAQTYHPAGKPVFAIDNTVCVGLAPEHVLNGRRSSHGFLWMNSGTLVHKGLDLALEVFAANQENHLWICGPIWNEPSFMRVYRRELFGCANIHPLGFIPVGSEDFSLLARRCTFALGTSCAEGMTGSVLNAMCYGLIPIVTRECGIDTDDIGITLRESTISGLREAVNTAVGWSRDECISRGKRTLQVTAARYQPETFATQFEAAMRQALAVPEVPHARV